MAENCTRAFGRYLKTLRDRRGLSLYDVCSLSQTFPEKLNKGYLSRCENGHQKLAFAKVIPLSRIYEVPADVLVERMELDMELDRVGGPETEGKEFAELVADGQQSVRNGYNWDGYGYFREAVCLAADAPVLPAYRDLKEQIAITRMNCSTAAKSLGRTQYVIHEYTHLKNSGDLGPAFQALIIERIAVCHADLKNFSLAEKFADEAIRAAEERGDRTYLGFLYSSRARLALDAADVELAATYYRKAFDVFKALELKAENAKTLNNLAICYFHRKRYGAARRALLASAKVSTSVDQFRSLAISNIMLGEIEEAEEKPVRATKYCREALRIAKKINDKELRFRAELLLLRQAIESGDSAVARAINRRLRRLSPWVSVDTEGVDTYRRLVSDNERFLHKSA